MSNEATNTLTITILDHNKSTCMFVMIRMEIIWIILWFHLLVSGVVQPAETHTHNQTQVQTQRSRTSEPRLSVCPRSCSDQHFWETERCESAGCWTEVCQCPYWLEIEDPLQMTETNINFWQYQRNRDKRCAWTVIKIRIHKQKKVPHISQIHTNFNTCKKWTVKEIFNYMYNYLQE